MRNSDKLIVVTGATGQQGGATARHLLAQGWRVRALIRDPTRARPPKRWRPMAPNWSQGDLDDRASLDRAFAGRLRRLQRANLHGCRTLARPARCARVRSAGRCRQGSGNQALCLHLGRRRRAQERPAALREQVADRGVYPSLGLPATVLRPVFFMENLTVAHGWGRGTVCWRTALKPTTSLQMIAVDDIGSFAALAFARPQEFIGKALELAGDSLTMPQVAEAMHPGHGPAGAVRRSAAGASAQLQPGDCAICWRGSTTTAMRRISRGCGS